VRRCGTQARLWLPAFHRTSRTYHYWSKPSSFDQSPDRADENPLGSPAGLLELTDRDDRFTISGAAFNPVPAIRLFFDGSARADDSQNVDEAETILVHLFLRMGANEN